MSLTKQRSAPKSDDFPTVQLFLLAIVRLAEPIALTSIFPYAWALVKRFQVGQEEDASFYAGLLISAFSLAEALTGMYWGGLSDCIGRKPVLLIGCFGTMFSMIMVGVASNLWVALAGRTLGGLLNGNIGVIQTMVGELVKRPEHEPRAYSVMPFVWSIGTILGPFVGGTFADPHESFPNLFPEGSLFHTHPYLLPNLICAGLLFVSIVLGWFLLVETHPDMQPSESLVADSAAAYMSEETPLLETSDAIKRPAVDMRDDNYGTVRDLDAVTALETTLASEKNDEEAEPSSSIYTKRIVTVMIALCIYAYHSMTYDHLMPIFFEDDRVVGSDNSLGLNAAASLVSPTSASPFSFFLPGGLGLSVRDVGMIMAVNGGIALFIQAVVFPMAAERLGVFRLFLLITVFQPVAYMLVPNLLLVPESLLYPAIYFCLTIRNLLSIILYPLLLIMLKESTPTPRALGKVNGLAASAGAGCRMIAPPVAGWLYTSGSKVGCSALAWYGSAVVALVGSVQCFSVPRPKCEQETEEAALEVSSAGEHTDVRG